MQRSLLPIRVCLLLLLASGAGAAQSTTETAQGIPINDPLIIAKTNFDARDFHSGLLNHAMLDAPLGNQWR